MVTISEIARHCGVSIATVSKALNRGGDISEATVQRVRQAAQALGYAPNAAARALKTKHSHNLGLLTQLRDSHGRAHEFVSLVISAFQAEAERRGYDVTLVSQQAQGATMSYVEHCRYRGFDGIALICADFLSPAVRELLESLLPCVTVDAYPTRHASVMTDNEAALDALVAHAYGLGHRRIAYIGGKGSAIAEIRAAAFRKACARHGLQPPAAYLDSAEFNDLHAAAVATRRLLRLPERPTCILYPDDYACLGGMAELEAQGLSVPEEMSVIGFDGLQLGQLLRPHLTTYRQDTEAIGRLAVQRLLETVADGDRTPAEPLWIPGQLIPGETVARLSKSSATPSRAANTP